MKPSTVEFLTLLAFTQLECGRSAEAAAILRAVCLVAPTCIDASRLLALAQLRCGDSDGCLQTIANHQRNFGAADKARQLAWIRIRALHVAGQFAESKQLLAQLRQDIGKEREQSTSMVLAGS